MGTSLSLIYACIIFCKIQTDSLFAFIVLFQFSDIVYVQIQIVDKLFKVHVSLPPATSLYLASAIKYGLPTRQTPDEGWMSQQPKVLDINKKKNEYHTTTVNNKINNKNKGYSRSVK